MKNKELFYHSVNILQKAYYDNTLRHGDCQACAVGNLVAGNLGVKYNAEGCIDWDEPRKSIVRAWFQAINHGFISHNALFIPIVKESIESTKYSPEELMRIEMAFEYGYKYTEDKGNIYATIGEDNDGYKGLCEVLDVLMEIHEFDAPELDKTKVFNKEELILI